MARPTKYTPELGERIALHVGYGAPLAHAAQAEGVCDDTVKHWLGIHPEFLAAVERAKGQAVTRNLDRVNAAAANGSWRASVWLLEHLDTRFSPVPQRLEVEGSVDLNVRVEQLSDDELTALAAGQSVRAISTAAAEGAGRVGAETPQEDQALAS